MMLTDKLFEQIVGSFSLELDENSSVAVAVSGGADSLCLMLLLEEYCSKKNINLIALTVDHKIRAESTFEAAAVHAFCKEKGIIHHILTIEEKIGDTAVEEEAREKRYELLTSFCKKNNVNYLFVAHQQEDQIETFFSRLARGSGVDGLGAIKNISFRAGVQIVRPFLNIPKKEIVNYLTKRKISWVEDPMNHDLKYERVKWRHLLPVLEENGLSLKSISLSISRLQRVQKSLDFMVDAFLKSDVSFYEEGYALINQKSFSLLPDELKIRVLVAVLKTIGQTDKFISLELLERLIFKGIKKETLAHCHVIMHKRGIFVSKEATRMEKSKKIKAGILTRWDRFDVLSSVDGVIRANPPLNRKKNIPYLVQQSFPCFEKELENGDNIQYKNSSNSKIDIKFIKAN